MVKNPKIKTVVVHSLTKSAWNVVGKSLGGKYKICRVPYIVTKDEKVNEINRIEAYEHANYISHCFNNSDAIFDNKELAKRGVVDKFNIVGEVYEKGKEYQFVCKHENKYPLNEKWLLEFGFKKGWVVYSLEVTNYVSFWIDIETLQFKLAFNDEYTETLNIKYVHQVVDLFNALTVK